MGVIAVSLLLDGHLAGWRAVRCACRYMNDDQIRWETALSFQRFFQIHLSGDLMNITLRQLRAFVAVACTGSFTLAAERLFVTQSALSGLIKELEQSLGVRLFDRSTRRIELSDVGRGIFPLIDKILLDLDRVIDEVTNLKALKKGLARVAAPQLMACTLLPEVIGSFHGAFPEIGRAHV